MNRVISINKLPFQLMMKGCLNLYQNSRLEQKIKVGDSILRHSTFSEFMGLASQLRKLQKEQYKNQRKQVRFNVGVIIVCSIGLTCGAIFLGSDEAIRLKWLVLKKRMQLSFVREQNRRKTINEEILNQIVKFLESNPYEYLTVVSLLNNFVSQIDRQSRNQQILLSLVDTYRSVLTRNASANSNKLLLQGISSLILHSLQDTSIDFKKLRQVLLEQGSLKQMYLAVKLMQQSELINLSHKLIIKNNLQRQIHKSSQYFNNILQNLNERELTHMALKRSLVQSWKQYIIKRLHTKQL